MKEKLKAKTIQCEVRWRMLLPWMAGQLRRRRTRGHVRSESQQKEVLRSLHNFTQLPTNQLLHTGKQ